MRARVSTCGCAFSCATETEVTVLGSNICHYSLLYLLANLIFSTKQKNDSKFIVLEKFDMISVFSQGFYSSSGLIYL